MEHSQNEQLGVRVEIATKKDLEEYKKLRLTAITSPDAEMFGATPEKNAKEQVRTDQEWLGDLLSDDMFVVLVRDASQAVGMLRVQRKENDVWYLSSAYTEENSRGKIFARKVFTDILNEIQKRGGSKVLMGVKAKNETMIRLATLLGFTKVETEPNVPGFFMELDLSKK